jgi:hypothetical protein
VTEKEILGAKKEGELCVPRRGSGGVVADRRRLG